MKKKREDGIRVLKGIIGSVPDFDSKDVLMDLELWASFGRTMHEIVTNKKFVTYSMMEDTFEKMYKGVYN